MTSFEPRFEEILEAADAAAQRGLAKVSDEMVAAALAGAPEKIALLRLDTDWYESTRHEFEHSYPRLSGNGVLIVDDYGSWQGSQIATDEYFEKNNIVMFLQRVDFLGCRMGVKR